MVKAIVPKHFSICVFMLTQIVLDAEVLWNGLRHKPFLHGAWHTYVGASFIGVFCFLLGKPLVTRMKRTWNRIAAHCSDADVSVPEQTKWIAAFTGAFFGAYSHIVLDSMFHPDIRPMQPWSAKNALFGIIDPTLIQAVSILLGIAGVAIYLRRERKERSANRVRDGV